jgi:mycothiol system anti-sigma-R factor
MISCTDAVRQLWEYLDGTVGEADRQALEEHLSRCRRCCAELEFAEEMQGFLADRAREDIPDDVMARLNATLDELGGSR